MTTSSPLPLLQRPINAWWIAVSAAIALVFGAGTLNVLFNVAVGPVTKEFGWTLADFTNGASLATVMAAISAAVMGMLVSRYGPKIPTIPTSLAFGVAVMLMATATEGVWSWYALCTLLGAVAGASIPVAHATVVTAWFSNRRGLALGLLAAGSSMGSIVMPPFATWLAASFGWRGIYIGVGLLCLIIPPAVYAFVTRMPPGVEMKIRDRGAVPEALLGTLTRSRQFWLLLVGIVLVSTAMFGLLSQVFPIATSHGYSREVAALMLTSFGISSLSFRFIVGFLIDRIYAPGIAVVLFTLGAVGVVVLFTSDSVALSLLGAVLVGAAYGGETDIAMYVASRYFPPKAYAKIVALVYFVHTAGGAIGIFLVGQLYVASGGYTLPMVVLVTLVVIGTACFLGFGRYKYRLDGTPVDAPAVIAPRILKVDV